MVTSVFGKERIWDHFGSSKTLEEMLEGSEPCCDHKNSSCSLKLNMFQHGLVAFGLMFTCFYCVDKSAPAGFQVLSYTELYWLPPTVTGFQNHISCDSMVGGFVWFCSLFTFRFLGISKVPKNATIFFASNDAPGLQEEARRHPYARDLLKGWKGSGTCVTS